jgi:hypothetical protein
MIELGYRSESLTFDLDAPTLVDSRLGFDTKVAVRPRYVTPRLPFWSNATSLVSSQAETPPCGSYSTLAIVKHSAPALLPQAANFKRESRSREGVLSMADQHDVSS